MRIVSVFFILFLATGSPYLYGWDPEDGSDPEESSQVIISFVSRDRIGYQRILEGPFMGIRTDQGEVRVDANQTKRRIQNTFQRLYRSDFIVETFFYTRAFAEEVILVNGVRRVPQQNGPIAWWMGIMQNFVRTAKLTDMERVAYYKKSSKWKPYFDEFEKKTLALERLLVDLLTQYQGPGNQPLDIGIDLAIQLQGLVNQNYLNNVYVAMNMHVVWSQSFGPAGFTEIQPVTLSDLHNVQIEISNLPEVIRGILRGDQRQALDETFRLAAESLGASVSTVDLRSTFDAFAREYIHQRIGEASGLSDELLQRTQEYAQAVIDHLNPDSDDFFDPHCGDFILGK